MESDVKTFTLYIDKTMINVLTNILQENTVIHFE